MTTSIATMDSRDFLRESVKEYIKEYKNERVLKEKRLEEIRVDENINRILSEQSTSLDDIKNNLSVDPFSGKKIDMTKVVPPEEEKLVAKDFNPGAGPAIIPTDKKGLERTAANAVKGGKLAVNALFGDPSGVISQCSDAYGMISAGAGSIIGWNLEFIATPLIKLMIQFLKLPIKGTRAVYRKIFKSGATAVEKVATKSGPDMVKATGVALTSFGRYLGRAGSQILKAAVVLGLLSVTMGAMSTSDLYKDAKNIGWVTDYGDGAKAVNSKLSSTLSNIMALDNAKDELIAKYKNISVWDFCKFPNDKAQQCFFAGVTAGLSARMTLKLITTTLAKLVKYIAGGWKKVFTAAQTKTGGAKEAIEQANLKELSDEISSLKGQVADLQDNTGNALDRAYKEGLEDGAKLGNEGWIINNAIDMFQPKQVVIDTISKNRDVFTEDVIEKLGKSKFTMGVWADDPKKGFRLAIELSEDAKIDEKTLQRIQEVLDGASRNRTDAIHRSLQESSEQLHRNSDFVAAKGAAAAGAKLTPNSTSSEAFEAVRRTEILNVFKEETEVITRAVQHSTNEMKAASKGVEEALKDLPEPSKKALQDAFDVQSNRGNNFDLEEFKGFLKEQEGLSDDIIEKFHKSQSKVVANAQMVEKILEERIKNSDEILQRLSIQGNGNFKTHFAGAGKADAGFFNQSQESIGDIGKQVREASAQAGDSKYLKGLNEKITEMSGRYKNTYFGDASPKPVGSKSRSLSGNSQSKGPAKAPTTPDATQKTKPFASATANLKPDLRRKRLGKLFRVFKRDRIEWPGVAESLRDSRLFGNNFKFPEELLAPNSALAKAFENSKNVDQFLKAAKEITDQYNKNLLENKKGIKIMTESNIRELVKELFKENSGQGYSKYPYGSSVRDQEEPKEDYVEEWKALSVEVIRDETRGTAIEIAKILVEDLELFEDVLDLAGQNQSIGTEILTKLKQIKEKA